MMMTETDAAETRIETFAELAEYVDELPEPSEDHELMYVHPGKEYTVFGGGSFTITAFYPDGPCGGVVEYRMDGGQIATNESERDGAGVSWKVLEPFEPDESDRAVITVSGFMSDVRNMTIGDDDVNSYDDEYWNWIDAREDEGDELVTDGGEDQDERQTVMGVERGDQITVQYNSVHSSSIGDTTLDATVTRIRSVESYDKEGWADVAVFLSPDGEDQDEYEEPRRILINVEHHAVELQGRNGARWNRMCVSEPSVTIQTEGGSRELFPDEDADGEGYTEPDTSHLKLDVDEFAAAIGVEYDHGGDKRGSSRYGLDEGTADELITALSDARNGGVSERADRVLDGLVSSLSNGLSHARNASEDTDESEDEGDELVTDGGTPEATDREVREAVEANERLMTDGGVNESEGAYRHEFWNAYQIPFEWDVAIKGRLSGLSRDSSGDGRDSRTVEHLFVEESFSEGRLSRDEGSYLCGGGASYQFAGERHRDEDGEEYVPPVTCSRCLELMERWEREDEDQELVTDGGWRRREARAAHQEDQFLAARRRELFSELSERVPAGTVMKIGLDWKVDLSEEPGHVQSVHVDSTRSLGRRVRVGYIGVGTAADFSGDDAGGIEFTDAHRAFGSTHVKYIQRASAARGKGATDTDAWNYVRDAWVPDLDGRDVVTDEILDADE